MASGTIWTNLPTTLVLEAIYAGPFATLGVWLALVGRKIWVGKQNARSLQKMRGILLFLSDLTVAYGLFAIQAADQSDARGGG